ncbi:hypothetical protein C8J57DRAFT_1240075 [Mycena rebaudengoi]|nr:hypothetical protein C8J57DRAFT_1240075 [Mycena rebaudengoi]
MTPLLAVRASQLLRIGMERMGGVDCLGREPAGAANHKLLLQQLRDDERAVGDTGITLNVSDGVVKFGTRDGREDASNNLGVGRGVGENVLESIDDGENIAQMGAETIGPGLAVGMEKLQRRPHEEGIMLDPANVHVLRGLDCCNNVGGGHIRLRLPGLYSLAVRPGQRHALGTVQKACSAPGSRVRGKGECPRVVIDIVEFLAVEFRHDGGKQMVKAEGRGGR